MRDALENAIDGEPLVSLDQLVPDPDLFLVRDMILESPAKEQMESLLKETPLGCFLVKTTDTLFSEAKLHATPLFRSGSFQGMNPGVVRIPTVRIDLSVPHYEFRLKLDPATVTFVRSFLSSIGFQDGSIPIGDNTPLKLLTFTLPA